MLRPENNEVPELTRLVARATLLVQIGDELGPVYHDEEFAALYPASGHPVESPARLDLATVMQFAENLADRQAGEAVRDRVSWKYVLGLELTDPGFHYSLLSEFH